jgi:hypothetical protein
LAYNAANLQWLNNIKAIEIAVFIQVDVGYEVSATEIYAFI